MMKEEHMDWKLELVAIPISVVDRAKDGWAVQEVPAR